MKSSTFAVLILSALLLAGCASSKKAAEAVHPLAGAWEYIIDSPQGVYTGVLSFTAAGDMLSGAIAASEQPDQAAPLEELTYDAETHTARFKFDSGQYGVMIVNMTLAGDALEGTMNVMEYGVDVPIKATRKAAR